MDRAYHIDRAWFGTHPREHRYRRIPLANEWEEFPIPQEAVVTVHLINDRCTVRVLEIPDGARLATALDTELEEILALQA